MSKQIIATVHHPERKAEWISVFGTNAIPVKSPFPCRGNVPIIGDTMYFELDIEALTGEQMQQLIKHLADKFGLDLDFVQQRIGEHGVPIVADQVVITGYRPPFWLD